MYLITWIRRTDEAPFIHATPSEHEARQQALAWRAEIAMKNLSGHRVDVVKLVNGGVEVVDVGA